MSINPINSVSIYEYYYQINNKDEEDNKTETEKALEELGIQPTTSESLNVKLLEEAQEKQKTENDGTISYSQRPWAEIMRQLNIGFNEDPQNDIKAIRTELRSLILNFPQDDELNQEITDLEDYIQTLYAAFTRVDTNSDTFYYDISSQLKNTAMINSIHLL